MPLFYDRIQKTILLKTTNKNGNSTDGVEKS